MKLKNSGKAAIVISALVGSSHVLAEGQNVDFYGNIAAGYNSYNMSKVDTEDAKVAAAYAEAAGTEGLGPDKDMTYSSISSGYATAKFGANFVASDKVTGKLEFKTGLDDGVGDNAPTVRKYYLKVDLGAGNLKFGRDGRIYAGVAGAADRFSMANTSYAGTVYGPNHAAGITYDTGDLLGPATVKLGLVNPTTGDAAPKATGNHEPGIEAGVSFTTGGFGGHLAVVSEKRNYDGADGRKTADAMGYSLALKANVAMIDAALVYTGGDALYEKVARGASINKDQNDTLSAIALNVQANLDDLNLGVYYGMETMTHNKKNTAFDKDKDDVGTTMALHVVYAWNGVTWTGEIANTTRKYDSQTVRDEMFGTIGAMTSFKS